MTIFSKFANVSPGAIKAMVREAEKRQPPPIEFSGYKRNKMISQNGEEVDYEKAHKRGAMIKFKIPFNTKDDKSGTYDSYLWKFDDGTPEEWVYFLMEIENTFAALDITKKVDRQHEYYEATLTGKARDVYNRAWAEANRTQGLSKKEAMSKTINAVTTVMFDNMKNAVRKQKRYMRTMLYLGGGDPTFFCARLRKMNDYLPYFPEPEPGKKVKKLDEDDIILNSVKMDWLDKMLVADKDEADWSTTVEAELYFKRLYLADQNAKVEASKSNSNPKRAGKKRRKLNDDDDEDEGKSHPKKDHSKKEWRKKSFNGFKKRSKPEAKKETSSMLEKMMEQMLYFEKKIEALQASPQRKRQVNYSAQAAESDAEDVPEEVEQMSCGSGDYDDEASAEDSTT